MQQPLVFWSNRATMATGLGTEVIMSTEQKMVYDDREIERDHAEWQGFRKDWFVLYVGMPLASAFIIVAAMVVGIFHGLK